MFVVRKADERGTFDFGWLQARYSFSFARYVDRAHMGFRTLRVMNEDRIQAGQGFGTHPHDNMEIITYVLEGELEHRDSMGNGSVIRPGEFQKMSAGSGVTHSEFNPSATTAAHIYQIWIHPSERDIEPSYEQRSFVDAPRNEFVPVVSPDASEDAMTIRQDAKLYLLRFDPEKLVQYHTAPSRGLWIQVLRGSVEIVGELLEEGDGIRLEEEEQLSIRTASSGELLLFDLA